MAGNWCCAVPGRGEFANDLCGLRDGGSALMVAAIAHLIPFNLQVVFWMALSLALVLVSRRFVRQKAAKKLDATEAETLTEIPTDKTGHALYEGNSWAARCEMSS